MSLSLSHMPGREWSPLSRYMFQSSILLCQKAKVMVVLRPSMSHLATSTLTTEGWADHCQHQISQFNSGNSESPKQKTAGGETSHPLTGLSLRHPPSKAVLVPPKTLAVDRMLPVPWLLLIQDWRVVLSVVAVTKGGYICETHVDKILWCTMTSYHVDVEHAGLIYSYFIMAHWSLIRLLSRIIHTTFMGGRYFSNYPPGN